MKLIDILKDYKILNESDIPYFKICDFIVFYHAYKNNEYFCINLNKSLISINDLTKLNKITHDYAKIKVTSSALKNDFLYIKLYEYSNILQKLTTICEYLKNLGYHSRHNCLLCGCETNMVNYQNFLIPLDQKCQNKIINEDAGFKQNNKKLKIAILLALLGGLIGILPSIIIAIILESYSIISTILLFLSPFLSAIFFYKSGIYRQTKNDILIALIALFYQLIYQIVLVVICLNASHATSFIEYYNYYKNFIIENIIGLIFTYFVGYFAALFLSKKKILIRFKGLR